MPLPVRHNIGAFPTYMWKSEATIINRLISEILNRGLSVSVYDGCAYPVKRSTNRAEIQRNVAATDETHFWVRDADGNQVAWFLMMHGNWCDVISDCTDNDLTNEIMRAIEPTINRQEGKQ
ncbi:hypothetical protein PXK56_18270 [Phaeobacter gallaeciensis]|uniref:hypothetical protein n=1 Tax=Phaeobacter gallaeciensis TaxID=60890 RepID=UPI002380A457|nr:hypothetical protein [Phaeobacter gallaeciensis]MDE4297133.1 hypothetical protein [Phaeobacter gallaeciensis]